MCIYKQVACSKLKEHLSLASMLGYPNPSWLYILNTNASGCRLEAVQSKVQGEATNMIAFVNKILTSAEKNYCVTLLC